METAEIANLAVSSCRRYYDYLTEQEAGRSEINVHEIVPNPSVGGFSLRLASKLFDTDGIFFLFGSPRRELDTNIMRIRSYDRDRNVLVVSPKQELMV